MQLVYYNEATASRRRIWFHLVGSDGVTPATGEVGGQPQVTDGTGFTDTGIGALVNADGTTVGANASGRYYADLTTTLLQASLGARLETRYKSASTAECPGDSVQVVGFNPADASILGLTGVAPKSATDAIRAMLGTGFTGIATSNVHDWLLAMLRSDAPLPADIDGTYDPAAHSLQALAASLAASAGSGAFTLSVTVEDQDGDPLQNARVRYAEGVSTFYAVTDADGLCTLNVDAATYTVAITKDGYAYAGSTDPVSGSSSRTFAMTQTVVAAAADPTLTSATLTAYSKTNSPVAGAAFQVALLTGPGDAGRSYPCDFLDLTSDGSGVVQTDLLRSATYRIRRQKASGAWSDWKEFTTPDAASYTIPEVLGKFGAS